MDPNPAVINAGSSSIKAGACGNFPTDTEPRVVIPPAVHDTSIDEALQLAAERGDLAARQTCLDCFADPPPAEELVLAVDQGAIVNWDAYETLCHYIFYQQLGWIIGDEGSVLVTEPLFANKLQRERTAQTMFETFNTAGLVFCDEPTLSLYAVGKLTGTVIDVGHSKIDIATVQEGLLHNAWAQRIPFGCRDLATHLGRLLQSSGATPSGGGLTRQQLSGMLAACAEVPDGPEGVHAPQNRGGGGQAGQGQGGEQGGDGRYTLPDGTVVMVKHEGRMLGEALVQCTLPGVDSTPIASRVVESQQWQLDVMARRAWLESVMVCGGGSGIPGLTQRLVKELKAVALPSSNVAPCTCPEYMPDTTMAMSTWVGGAVLAKVVFGQEKPQNQHAITRMDYDEVGPSVVHRKTF